MAIMDNFKVAAKYLSYNLNQIEKGAGDGGGE